MVAPALALIAARAIWHARIEPLLERVDGFLSGHADSATRLGDGKRGAGSRRDRGTSGRLVVFAG